VYVLTMLIATLIAEGPKGLANQDSKKNPFMGG
jgi:hypothetical protein